MLLEETEARKWQPRTNKELATWAIERDLALQQCNADKMAMRDYFRRMQETKNGKEGR